MIWNIEDDVGVGEETKDDVVVVRVEFTPY